MQELSKFIANQNKLKWQPGAVDCLMSLSDWIVTLGWPDAAAPYRGKYHDDAGMWDFVLKGGGIENLIDDEVSKHGIKRCDDALAGDIAVIGSSYAMRRQFGAIWDGENWLVLTKTGYLEMKSQALAIWRTGGASCLL